MVGTIIELSLRLSLIVRPFLIEDVLVQGAELGLRLEGLEVLLYLGRILQSLTGSRNHRFEAGMHIHFGLGVRRSTSTHHSTSSWVLT